MKTYKDIFIDVGDKGIVDLIKNVTKIKDGLWSRSYENEENSKYLGEPAFCFKRENDSSLPEAGLSIFLKEDNIWYIPNVVPTKSGQLSYDQYNTLLTEFYDNYLVPASAKTDVSVRITSDTITDEEVLGVEGARLLESFSLCANKSTGSSHPCDQKRWFAFLVEVCRSDTYVETDKLERILAKQGWSESLCEKLAIQFEFARDFIEYMEK